MKRVKHTISLFLTLIAIATTSAQVRVIGTVFDQDNKIVPGTNVLQMGTPNGKAVDWNGKFEIDLPEGEHTLLFAFIGYKPYEHKIRVDKNTKVNIEINLIKDERRNRKLKSSGKEFREAVVLQ
jgi:hypothetical protein